MPFYHWVYRAAAVLLFLSGCSPGGNPAEITDVEIGSAEELYAASVRNEVDALMNSFRDERGGVPGLKSYLDGGGMENIEFMESELDDKAGQYKESCSKILQGIHELHQMLQGAANAGDVRIKLEELQQTAEQLPAAAVHSKES